MFTRAELATLRKSWKEHTKYSGESTLLVLPCNAGGPTGSYFRGNNGHNLWTHCAYYLKEWRDDLVFMAVDNAVCWLPGRDDGLGSGEFEWEVSRACSPEDYGIPTANRFDAAKMVLFVESLRIICQRIKDYGFTRVFAILTPSAYRTAFMKAAEIEKLPVALFSAGRCGVANVAAQILRCLLLTDYQVQRSVLLTHDVLENVPLPKPPAAWKIDDPVAKLRLRDLSQFIGPVQGKYSKYYTWTSETGTEEAWARRYLVSEKEDFSIFKLWS